MHRETTAEAATATAKIEPAHEAENVDTSVNRDIDRQLANAQRANDDDNLLEPAPETLPVPVPPR